jgi:hypothetical protein
VMIQRGFQLSRVRPRSVNSAISVQSQQYSVGNASNLQAEERETGDK